jgi:hypothetical protein
VAASGDDGDHERACTADVTSRNLFDGHRLDVLCALLQARSTGLEAARLLSTTRGPSPLRARPFEGDIFLASCATVRSRPAAVVMSLGGRAVP